MATVKPSYYADANAYFNTRQVLQRLDPKESYNQ